MFCQVFIVAMDGTETRTELHCSVVLLLTTHRFDHMWHKGSLPHTQHMRCAEYEGAECYHRQTEN